MKRALIVSRIAILTLLAVLTLGIGCSSTRDPAEIATELGQDYINDNIDYFSEQIAGVITDQNPILREIGGELIEDEVHENVNWTFSQPTAFADDVYQLVATAKTDFEVGVAVLKYTVVMAVPVDLTIDVVSERVDADIDISGAQIDVDG